MPVAGSTISTRRPVPTTSRCPRGSHWYVGAEEPLPPGTIARVAVPSERATYSDPDEISVHATNAPSGENVPESKIPSSASVLAARASRTSTPRQVLPASFEITARYACAVDLPASHLPR